MDNDGGSNDDDDDDDRIPCYHSWVTIHELSPFHSKYAYGWQHFHH